ncbi:unnamed protein product [Caenorhabditis brenneri]
MADNNGEIKLRCSTDYVAVLYGLSIAVVTVIFSFVVYSEPSEKKFTVAHTLLVTSLIILLGSALLRLLMKCIHWICLVGRLKRIRNNLLVGFAGISICGVAPRILVFFLEDTVEAHLYCFFIPVITATIFFVVFTCFDRPWEMNYQPNLLLFTAITFLHVFISIVFLGFFCEESHIGKFKLIISVLTPPFFACGSVDFLAVLMGGLDWENGIAPLVKVKVVKNKGEVAPAVDLMNLGSPKASECEICTLEYSDSLIPRILTNCGHTICQLCARNFLNNSRIACPFCRTVTKKIYQAKNLPKNHLAIDLINKVAGSEFCKSCNIGYSDSVIPRVLVNCGHSVCEVCAGKLLGEGDKIKCVACKKVTKGYKEASGMPKNFVALELIKEGED